MEIAVPISTLLANSSLKVYALHSQEYLYILASYPGHSEIFSCNIEKIRRAWGQGYNIIYISALCVLHHGIADCSIFGWLTGRQPNVLRVAVVDQSKPISIHTHVTVNTMG